MVYKDYLIAYVLKAKAKQRRKSCNAQQDCSDLNDAQYIAQPAHPYFENQSSGPTYTGLCPCCHKSRQLAQSQHSDVVRPDRLQHAQYHVVEQLRVPKDSLFTQPVPHGGKTPPKAGSRHALQTPEADLIAASRYVRGSQHDSCTLAAGSMLFGAFLFICGNAPWLLPAFYLLFAAVCLPWRVHQFYRNSQGFFLLDFCYTVNLAAVGYLLFGANWPQLGMMVSALADGPLACALLVWQCSWVFGSASHAVSVLVHLLPGLALFALQHAPVPTAVSQNSALQFLSLADRFQQQQHLRQHPHQSAQLIWLVLAPLGFYAVWQLSYWFIVQVCCEKFIIQHKYDTSYSCLAKRAAKTNSLLNRFIRRGCKARRIFLFGCVQLAFTLMSLVLYIPVHHSFYLAYLWQIIKVAVTVYYGSRYQCEKVPQLFAIRAAQDNKVHLGLAREGKIAALKAQKATYQQNE